MKFVTTLERDEDGVWVVECPSIPGCVSQDALARKLYPTFARRLLLAWKCAPSADCPDGRNAASQDGHLTATLPTVNRRKTPK
jgi:hypothetical protein